MSNEVIKEGDYDLGYLAELAKRDNNISEAKKLPNIKVNYDSDSVHGVGSFIIGQEKDKDGKITNQGKKVTSIVILRVKNQYAFFDEKTKVGCYSPLHDDFEAVEGNHFHNKCGKTCPYKTQPDKACRAQKVIICTAITEEKEKIEGMMYLHGSSYMPLVDYVKANASLEIEGKIYPVPYYSFVTTLSTTKEKYQGRDYYIANFSKGMMLKMDNIKKFAEKLVEVDNFIEMMNSMNAKSDGNQSQSIIPVNSNDVVDVTADNTVNSSQATTTPQSSGTVIVDDDDDLFKD